jgi:hypothetical protein
MMRTTWKASIELGTATSVVLDRSIVGIQFFLLILLRFLLCKTNEGNSTFNTRHCRVCCFLPSGTRWYRPPPTLRTTCSPTRWRPELTTKHVADRRQVRLPLCLLCGFPYPKVHQFRPALTVSSAVPNLDEVRPDDALSLRRELLQQRRDVGARPFHKKLSSCHNAGGILPTEGLGLQRLRNKHEYPRGL